LGVVADSRLAAAHCGQDEHLGARPQRCLQLGPFAVDGVDDVVAGEDPFLLGVVRRADGVPLEFDSFHGRYREISTSQACYNIGNQTFDDSTVSDDCSGGWHINKRTHVLANGEIIWDFSGNVAEWLLDVNAQTYGSTGPVQSESYGAENKLLFGPSGDHTQKTGTNYGGLGTFGGGAEDALLRGSLWYDSTAGGLFFAYLGIPSTTAQPNFGFRCVYAP